MASNYYASGAGYEEIEFDRPVGHINIFVASGVTLSLSVDGGENFISVPVGFYSFPIGQVYSIVIMANGAWQLLAIQE